MKFTAILITIEIFNIEKCPQASIPPYSHALCNVTLQLQHQKMELYLPSHP